MKYLCIESDLDMTEVWPPVPPVTREAPAAKHGVGAGGAAGNPPTPSVSSRRADFGDINGSSSSSRSDGSRTSGDSSNSKVNRDIPRLVSWGGSGSFR